MSATGTAVVLGLLTTKSPRLEYDGDVLARIEEAARFKPLAELALSTQCGFASVPIANPVTPAAPARQAGTGGPARPPGLGRLRAMTGLGRLRVMTGLENLRVITGSRRVNLHSGGQ